MKIKHNESFKELERQMEMLRPFIWGAKLAGKLGLKNELIEKAKEAPKQFDLAKELILLPDKFNEYFSEHGWIAYESLNVETMQAAVKYAESSKPEEAEKTLIDFYNEDQISFLKMRLKAIKPFQIRMSLIDKAVEDYFAGRYYSVVLVLLSLIDGIVADLSNNGLYAESSDVSAWDSIAGHVSGLEFIKRNILTKMRTKTNDDELDLPYRNGILHGRDLGYDNQKVAAKCWGLLFSIGDWARSLNNRPKEKENVSWKEVIDQISKSQKVKDALEEWKPRSEITKDTKEFDPNSPECACLQYLDTLKAGNYGKAALMRKTSFSNEKVNVKKMAGILREQLSNKTITKYEILEIEDQASAAANVKVKLFYKFVDGPENFVEGTVRLIYFTENGESTPRNLGGGNWMVQANALHSLDYTNLFLDFDI